MFYNNESQSTIPRTEALRIVVCIADVASRPRITMSSLMKDDTSSTGTTDISLFMMPPVHSHSDPMSRTIACLKSSLSSPSNSREKNNATTLNVGSVIVVVVCSTQVPQRTGQFTRVNVKLHRSVKSSHSGASEISEHTN